MTVVLLELRVVRRGALHYEEKGYLLSRVLSACCRIPIGRLGNMVSVEGKSSSIVPTDLESLYRVAASWQVR